MKNLLILSCLFFLFCCTNNKKEIVIEEQRLFYDSTKTKNKDFEVTLTTIFSTKDSISKKNLSNFYILANNDTLSLEAIHCESVDNVKKIYCETLLKKQIKIGSPDFINSVKNYKIKNKSPNIIITKSPHYSIEIELPLLPNRNPNIVE